MSGQKSALAGRRDFVREADAWEIAEVHGFVSSLDDGMFSVMAESIPSFGRHI